MKRFPILAAFGAVLLCAPLAAAPTDSFVGTWSNPSNSLHVRTYACGANLCGRVIWASDKQQAAAQRAGTPVLIGKQLFSDFGLAGRKREGKVFLPKQGKAFPATVSTVDADTMAIRGCGLGGLICKTQTWTRIPASS